MVGAPRTLFPPCFLFAAAVVTGCSASSPPTVLQPLDTTLTPGATFDPNEIVPTIAFEDEFALSPEEIAGFLHQNPYGTTSFLSTYQSSGVFASDAIYAAATKYRINPIVFLVRAEVSGGLVGDQIYPLPANQVEYAFGCGCTSPAGCDPTFAGFDKQVDCLGGTLRTSLDEIAMTGVTAGGWGPGTPSPSLDGERVVPVDASTAALYQYDPYVGQQSQSDNWLVWNVWNLYTSFLEYVPPPDPSAGATAQIGDPCYQSSDCAFASPICATGKTYPGGMCTSKCSGTCPGNDAFCADFTSAGYCLALCSPTDPASCRPGYQCTLIHQFGSGSPTTAQNVCAPM